MPRTPPRYAFTRKELETLLTITCVDFAEAVGFPHQIYGDGADSKALHRVVMTRLNDWCNRTPAQENS